MGFYLNNREPLMIYKSEAGKPYFVDKTKMLKELIPLVEQGNNHICITRPRRFGKSVMAAMIGAFFGKGFDSSSVFDGLEIASDPKYKENLNKHELVCIDFSGAANLSKSYDEFINKIESKLIRDLHKAFLHVEFWEDETVADCFRTVNIETETRFIFVFDEWDCIFHKKYLTKENRESFINFLAALTKGRAFVSLTYMTGVLPIAKYSSGSTINHFDEYNMANNDTFSEYFGFTDKEVDRLYEIYLSRNDTPTISREDLAYWYDGYHIGDSRHIYNPRSVVFALSRNKIGSYWTNTGPYSEISRYIENDIDGVKEDIALMVTGEAVPAQIDVYAATASHFVTKDEIFSAMVVYGFLNYERGTVRIPNKELMDEFAKTIKREKSMGYVNRLALVSDKILKATLEGDTKTVENILETIHNTESPILAYNRESELTLAVTFAYLSARDFYRIEREDKAGRGYVDFIFYPIIEGLDGIILELKVNDTPEAAVKQIKDKKYAFAFRGKLAENKRQVKRILAVGMAYDSKTGEHHCRIEEL